MFSGIREGWPVAEGCMALVFLGIMMTVTGARATVPSLDDCNVIWTTSSGDSSGSMPLGNGDIGLNVWVEANGDVLLLVSKTDSWDQNYQLLKLGRMRVTLTPREGLPSPFAQAGVFRQELKLREGRIEIAGGERESQALLRVWVDANRPAVCVQAEAASPCDVAVRLEPWRTETRAFTETEFKSNRDVETADKGVVVPDIFAEDAPDRVTWYHRNETSIWPVGMKLQGMESVMDRFADPLLNRTFGATVLGDGLIREDLKTLRSASPSKTHAFCVYPVTAQTNTVEAWREQLAAVVEKARAISPADALRDHEGWWRDFWDRSWVRVGGDDDARLVTQAYALQRWISACGGRGIGPIKFNGSIFTVEWRENGEVKSDPDYRAWGSAYWWQNTRLPYWPMLASGDYDLMRPMFAMYLDSLKLAEARTRIWFGCDGAFMPETMNYWGMYCNVDYGWNRAGLQFGEMVNPYIRWIWSSGLDLAMMLLDYYDHTGDETMARETLTPWADAMLRYFDTRFKRDADGKLLLDPTQSIETYQSGVIDDTPCVAGLRAVLPRLPALPKGLVQEETRARWKRLLGETPELFTADRRGNRVILPAKSFRNRSNCENPELYPVFPFRLYGVGRPDLPLAQATFDCRTEKAIQGWQQTSIQAACLGRADDARAMLVANAKRKHEGSRFPAFWGPNYDWIPDQCHGGNLLNTVQTMILQTDGKRILLLPAWPNDWDLEFKLHAPGRTVIEGVVQSGKLVSLRVEPPERQRDVEVLSAAEPTPNHGRVR